MPVLRQETLSVDNPSQPPARDRLGTRSYPAMACESDTCSERATLSGDASMYRQKDRWRMTQNSPVMQRSNNMAVTVFQRACEPTAMRSCNTAISKVSNILHVATEESVHITFDRPLRCDEVYGMFAPRQELFKKMWYQ